LTHQ